ncbi:iron chaperone [Microbacterium aoyamense]|uniref:Iron chaperone n=1 Tax=Microbacterium aoyamense TaxID=344166 RepID=A0ABP5B7S5_9MICO|nr:DUF1801 domain-containing protein [Microbacterium aoyamense]
MGTVDDYLKELDPTDRDVVAHVYAIAREEVPEAEQGLGYGMPALTYRGKPLVAVKRTQKHIGIYPFSPDAVSAVADAVAALPETGLDKGTIRFQPGHPLPDDVLRTLVTARKEQIER